MRSQPDRGFTLIEVLVAVFVLAVGVVGALGTQMAALRTRQQSSLMSDAVQLASSLADRMRANVEQMRSGPDNPYLALRYDAATDGPPPPAHPLCYRGADCSSAQLAEFDLYELKQAVFSGFPGGRVVICRDAQMWNAARHALDWSCVDAAGAPLVIKLGWRAKRPDGAAERDAAGDFAPSVAMLAPGVPE